MKTAILLSVFVATAFADCRSDGNTACINVYNKCPFTIWPGVQGSSVPEGGGFRLDAGQSRQLHVPNGWSAGRVWARTGCDGNFNCDTGFCGNSEQCSGRGGVPPVSLAEFTLHANGQDYYDVSLVDGYNIPVMIIPIGGSYRSNGGQYDCQIAGGCRKDINAECPGPMQVNKHGRVVACKSACMAFNTDEFCCRGSHSTPQTCPANQYSKMFKDACPKAYSYAYDDGTSTFFCRGNNQPSAAYTVQFC